MESYFTIRLCLKSHKHVSRIVTMAMANDHLVPDGERHRPVVLVAAVGDLARPQLPDGTAGHLHWAECPYLVSVPL